MYIIEQLIKIYLKLSKKENKIVLPDNNDIYELEDPVKCHHNFMPIDSTGNILACSKCGFLINKKKLKKKKN